jgi:AraC family transcriptional regulator, regulatory protein of adaptative response / methylated-DNA-[protein]-cysteine methyltransferase
MPMPVSTTGIYCRPGCAARLARPENVRFYNTRDDAERAGFSPCRRCRPDAVSPHEQRAALIEEACRALPGFVCAQSRALLGMTPRAYKSRGMAEVIRHATARCALGWVLVAMTEQGVCAISLGDDPAVLMRELEARFRNARLVAADQELGATIAKVVALVDDPRNGCDLPLDICGTLFEQRVWQALRDIPAGTSLTYSELAAAVGAPGAVRAVASACAANAIAVAIPCHRVLRRDGTLSGYRWGVARKRALLDREQE